MKSGILIITKKSALVKTCKVQGDWWSCKKVPLYVRKKKTPRAIPSTARAMSYFRSAAGWQKRGAFPTPA